MADGSPISESVDPLHSLFGVSLFPRTIRASTAASVPSDPKDLDSIHHFMKSVSLSSPEKLLDEAKAIVGGGSELLESKFPTFVESLDTVVAVAPEGRENLQGRRPGLGLKRPRFTFNFKPNTRSSVNLESNVDIFQIKDPEEFFYAFEKAETAKREIQRLMGGTTSDIDMHDQTMRGRRPGILGKSFNIKYKHRHSSFHSENDNNLTSSQETLELDLPGSLSNKSQEDKDDTDFEAQQTSGAGSVSKMEKSLNGLLDELLSNSDIDGDGVVSLLQERLEIKPIDPGELSIPDFHDVGRTNFMELGDKLPKARKTLSNISNLVKQLSGEVHVTQRKVGESPLASKISPTPPKNALGSISLLKKRSSESNSLRDPFSHLNVDLSEPRNACSGKNDDRQPPQVPVLKELSGSCNVESHVENELERYDISNVDLQTAIPRASDGLDASFPDENFGQEGINVDIQPIESPSDFIRVGTGDRLFENSAFQNTTKGQVSIDSSIASDRNTENVADRQEPAILSLQFNSHADDLPHESGKVEEMPAEAAVPTNSKVDMSQLQIVENVESDQLPLGQPKSVTTEDNPVVTPSITEEILTSKKSEKVQPSREQRAKRPRGESRELKALSRRRSIAERGTSFESGVRRSKRIRTRPLEYWKGERLLYGRVDESVKLIGLKYVSPGKGNGKLKVKAYVSSDEYKDILDLAARY